MVFEIHLGHGIWVQVRELTFQRWSGERRILTAMDRMTLPAGTFRSGESVRIEASGRLS